MVLVDTSVWIEHLRHGRRDLTRLLTELVVLTHPFVIGELACGNLHNRARILADLGTLPSAIPASDKEVLRMVNDRRLWGHGIGWVDAHLLAAALLSDCKLWTLDKQLALSARIAGLALHRYFGASGVLL